MKKNLLHLPKNKANFSKINEGNVNFSVENFGRFSQNSGNIKQEIITRNLTYELPHRFPKNLGVIVLGNEKLLRLFN